MTKEKNRIERSIIGICIIIILSLTAISASATPGAIYTMTNNASANQVLSYDRITNGSLITAGQFSTNGSGTGSSLSDQGSIVLSEDGKKLLVVNAGSNEISSFIVEPDGLLLTDKVNSGGTTPVSIAINKDLVYVVNAGVPGNIVGYNIDNNGKLAKIPGSTQSLSSNTIPVGPAEISFNPKGTILVVTERLTNKIDTYTMDSNGVAHGPIIHTSNGNTPFGFAFDKRGNLVVSEAATNTLSSYSVSDNGDIATISNSVPDFHLAPCWVVITRDGKFVYTNNAHDGTTSSYTDNKGSLELLEPIAGNPGAGNIDLALSVDSRFLYSLNPGNIAGFKINFDGSLTKIGTFNVVNGAEGLAAN